MIVLSLFDGMSCGRLALDRAGVDVTAYLASEIDPYAMAITQKNYPDTIQLGDVKNVLSHDLPNIDLLIGGSPCQGFSFAGHRLNFDDPRSKLFFEFVKVLEAVRPRYFLLENVRMTKESEDVITRILGVEPIEINSSLVSAQNRVRLYWTNIPVCQLPDDKGIHLADVIEHGYVDRVKSYCIDANYHKGGNLLSYFTKNRRQLVFRYNRKDGIKWEAGALEKSIPILASDWRGLNRNQDQNAVIDIDQLSFRKLTPLECERLQTVPEGYTEGVSNTQRYKMLGNGWTVDVIAHIFSFI